MSTPVKFLKEAGPKRSMMSVPKHDVYAPASEGPFRCDNCEYFTEPNKCRQEEIVKLRDGKVEPGACCDYFENKHGDD